MPDDPINPKVNTSDKNSDDTEKIVVEERVDQMMALQTAPLITEATKGQQSDGTLPGKIIAPDSGFQSSTADKSNADAADLAVDPAVASNSADANTDARTDELVDSIVAAESDELLAARDQTSAELAAAFTPIAQPVTYKQRIAAFFKRWWHNKPARYGTIGLLLAGLLVLSALPTSRYYAMNLVGIRSTTSLTILDNTTQLPLRNVAVSVGERQAKTNQQGLVKLSNVKLGGQTLSVDQPGFAPIKRQVTVGLGSNPQGEIMLTAVGIQFRFKLVDYLSNKPVTMAEISSGDAVAQANKQGEVILTLEAGTPQAMASAALQASVVADNYRTEKVSLQLGSSGVTSITLVASNKEVYVSKQSGKYDLFKIDVDGKNKRLLLAGTGLEDEDITVVQHPKAGQVALVSKRDNKRNQDGYLLQSLTLIDVDDGTTLALDSSENIRIVDWSDDRLVYVRIKAGTSAGNPERYQLISYDYNSTAKLQLATANYFNDVLAAKGSLYYTASNNYNGGNSQLVRINPDNSNKLVLLDKLDVYSISRVSYDSLSFSAFQAGYSYKLGDVAPRKVSDKNSPADEQRFYLDSPNGRYALWTESRDGKGVLLAHNSESGKDVVLATQSGLSYPVRWLNDRTVVYRVTTPAESADYAVSLDAPGSPRKLVDLTNTRGLGRWNYR